MLQGEPARPASQWPVVVRPPGSLIVAIGSLAVRAFGLTKAANYAISLAAAAMEMAMVDLADAMMGAEPGPGSRDKCDHARIQRRPQRRRSHRLDGRRSAFGQPRIARRPASVIRIRSILKVPPSTLSVSVTTVASPASTSIASIS